MINKVTLKQLYKDVFRRSTLISIPQLSELLETFNSEYTKWEIFYAIVRDALKTFEYYYPLGLIQKIWIEVDSNSRMSKITDNFEGYLNGAVPEDSIVIMPAAINGISTSQYTMSTIPLRMYRYSPPYIMDFWYSSNIYFCNCICKRPFFEEYDEVTKEPTDRCAVYYMSQDVDSVYSIFRDQLYVETCRYIMNIRKNMMLQNMPIELFQGLDEDFNRIDQNLQTIYQQASEEGLYLI